MADAYKEGKKLRKQTGADLWDAYYKIAIKYQLLNPEEIATACKIPVTDNEFHRVVLGNMIIALFVGRGSKNSSHRDLNIVGYTIPDKCKYSEQDFSIGCVSYGDMLTIGYPTEFGNSKVDLNVYYICKYSQGEARIPLLGLEKSEMELLAKHLCIRFEGQKTDSPEDTPFNDITSSQLYYHLQEWSLRHPGIAKNSTSPYFENWGDMALNRPMNNNKLMFA